MKNTGMSPAAGKFDVGAAGRDRPFDRMGVYTVGRRVVVTVYGPGKGDMLHVTLSEEAARLLHDRLTEALADFGPPPAGG